MGLTHFNGISITGSGLFTGEKGAEAAIFPGAAQVRVDAGTIGTSGHTTSHSTRLSSVVFVWTQAKDIVCKSGLVTRVTWSGHAFDVLNITTTGSANASSAIAWCAWGI